MDVGSLFSVYKSRSVDYFGICFHLFKINFEFFKKLPIKFQRINGSFQGRLFCTLKYHIQMKESIEKPRPKIKRKKEEMFKNSTVD